MFGQNDSSVFLYTSVNESYQLNSISISSFLRHLICSQLSCLLLELCIYQCSIVFWTVFALWFDITLFGVKRLSTKIFSVGCTTYQYKRPCLSYLMLLVSITLWFWIYQSQYPFCFNLLIGCVLFFFFLPFHVLLFWYVF